MNQPIQIIEKFYNFFEEGKDKEELVLYGGSGGAKSHSTCQHLVKELFSIPDISILVTRKTRPSLKATTWKMCLDIISEYGYIQDVDYAKNKTDLEIECLYNGSSMRFTSIDDPQKIKSASYNVAYVEEITEFTEEDWFFIKNTLRRPRKDKKPNQRIMTFNPVDVNHWVWQNIILKPFDQQTVLHSTHWDNPFLPNAYRQTLEQLIESDINYYRVYTLGEPGVLENVIYHNYAVELFDYPPEYYGLDFGYNNETALIGVRTYDQEHWLKELIYQTKLTNADLIEKLKILIQNRSRTIYADAAEPQRIEEIRQAGFRIEPANKSVRDGIDYVKRTRLHIHKDSINLIKEIQSYKYRETRDGSVLDEPVKFRDHILDATRYAVFTHNFGKSGHVLKNPVVGSRNRIPSMGKTGLKKFL